MEQIKQTIAGIMEGLERKKAAKGRDDPAQWLKKALTKRELAHIKVNYFKKGVLGLRVDSSSWLYNFNLHKEALLSKLQTGSAQVKDIRFRIGEVK